MAHDYSEDEHRQSFAKHFKKRHSDPLVLERLKRENGPSGGFEEDMATAGTPAGGHSGVGGPADGPGPGGGEMEPDGDEEMGPHPDGCMCEPCKGKRMSAKKSHHHSGGDLDMRALESSLREG